MKTSNLYKRLLSTALGLAFASPVIGAGENLKKYEPLDYRSLREYVEANQITSKIPPPPPPQFERYVRQEAQAMRPPPKVTSLDNLNYSQLQQAVEKRRTSKIENRYTKSRNIIPEPKKLSR